MGKRIRHLEYYGFNDQNVYIGLPNTDLSDIRETNREQDRDINEISGATKEKADISMVKELSGQVDTFIDVQSHINRKLIGAVKATFDNIGELRKRDKQITDKINEIGDKFDPIYDQLGVVSNGISSVEERLNAHLLESSETSEKVEGLDELVANKVDKDYADNTYAKKEDTYTKMEVDRAISNGISGLASEEWVINKKYLSIQEGDERYATKSSLGSLTDRVNDVQSTLYKQYNDLNTEFIKFKGETNNRLDTVYGRVETLEKKHEREVGNLQNKDVDLQNQIDKAKMDIKEINEVSLPNKVDNATFNNLKADVELINKLLDTKVDKDAYDKDKMIFGSKLDKLDSKKADKSDLDAANENIGELFSKIEAEAKDRSDADKELENEIGNVNERVNDVVEGNLVFESRITNLENGLKDEAKARVEGDEKLLGSESDKADADTIYGAKSYADLVAKAAKDNANAYTDKVNGETIVYVNNKATELEQKISGKADKEYVKKAKEEAERTFDSRLRDEIERATNAENVLTSDLRQEAATRLSEDNKLSTELSHTHNIVKAITDWDGDDIKDYTDEGTGILDVIHREFHKMSQEFIELKAKVEELEKKLN